MSKCKMYPVGYDPQVASIRCSEELYMFNKAYNINLTMVDVQKMIQKESEAIVVNQMGIVPSSQWYEFVR